MPYSELWDYDFFVDYSDDDIWKTHNSDTHFHRSYEIYYLVENEINYFIDDSVYHIIPGTLMVIPPNKIHTTRSINEKIRKRFLINLPETYIEDSIRLQPDILSTLPMYPILFKDSDQIKITQLFKILLKEYKAEKQNLLMIKSLLSVLLVYITRQGALSPTKSGNNIKIAKKMLHIVNYINENFQNDITLDSLSKKFYLNSSYISRTFKKELNISFSEYLRTVRIRAACKMLITTNLNVTEISDKAGFKSCTDFCRVFKSTLKRSPLQYRRDYQMK
ncbi:MAG: helix-turn-helix transcriptional regulator [Clostridia bacterium]|nr:helix-turn-helix transcriptional regulator [Clostridia bacterium]